jgi:hypothetical protein
MNGFLIKLIQALTVRTNKNKQADNLIFFQNKDQTIRLRASLTRF